MANGPLNSVFAMEIAQSAEMAAIGAARLRGQGDEKAADQAAVDAMRARMQLINMAGRVVIGEGERDEAPMLFIGEEVGSGAGPEIDIAVDPLEGTTLCAKAMANSLAVVAVAERGNLLNAPDVYMEKIAIGPGYAPGTVGLAKSVTENVQSLAKAKGVSPGELTACVLDRPRHGKIIAELRELGVSIYQISDGDVAGVIHTTNTQETGIDIYMGSGGAPEGVLAAAALRCIGGQMEGRLILDSEEKIQRAAKMGVSDPNKIFSTQELASGDVVFAATGVTDGNLLDGVKFGTQSVRTQTLVMESATGTVRTITTERPTS